MGAVPWLGVPTKSASGLPFLLERGWAVEWVGFVHDGAWWFLKVGPACWADPFEVSVLKLLHGPVGLMFEGVMSPAQVGKIIGAGGTA